MRPFITTVCLAVALTTSSASAQMIYQEFPYQTLGNSYFEQGGVNWNLRGPGFAANFGGGVVPPFGNPDPNAGLRGGVGFGAGGVSGNLGFQFGQGSSRSNVTTVPSITTMNGYPASFFSGTQRPFVTSISPVLGAQVIMPEHQPAGQELLNYQQAQRSEAQQRAMANQQTRQNRALASFERGKRAEAEGNLRMARANYRNALAAAKGPLRNEIRARMQARGW